MRVYVVYTTISALSREFEIRFSSNQDGLKDTIQSALDKLVNVSDIELKGFNQTFDASDGLNEQEEAIQSLRETAESANIDFERLVDVLVHLGYVAKEAANIPVPTTPQSISDVISSFSDMENKLSSVASALKEFEDNGRMTASTLSQLNETFSSLSSFDGFINTISSSSSSVDDVAQAMNALVTEYIAANDVLSNVNEKTVDLITSQLRAIGVSNAEEVATKALANAQAELAAQKIIAANPGLLDMTYAEIQAILTEAGVSEQAAKMVNYLALQKMLVNTNDMTTATSKEAEEMLNLAQKAGIAGNVLAQMGRKLELIKKAESGLAGFNMSDFLELQKPIAVEAPDLSFVVEIDTSQLPGAVSDAKSAAKDTKEALNEELDAIKEHYEAAKSIHSAFYNDIQALRDKEEVQAGIKAQSEYFRSLAELRDKYFEVGTADWEKFNRQITEDMIAAAKDAVDEVSKELDSLQSVYENLEKAVEEWDINKHISIDTFQDIMALGPQYLSYLSDENGMLTLNKQAVEAVMAAKIDELAVQRALQLVEQISILQKNHDIASLYALANAHLNAADGMWAFVNAQLAALNLQPQLLAAFQNQINLMQRLAKNAKASIGKETLSRKDYEQKQKKAAEDRTKAERKAIQEEKKAKDKYYDELIKRLEEEKKAQDKLYEKQIKNEQKLLDATRKRIQAQIDLLRRQEDQHDFETELAEKQKEVADLEAKIAAIQFDDSAETQKKRLELEAELAEKRKELEEFLHDYEVDQKEQALQDELDRYEESQEKKIEGIQDEKDAYDEQKDAEIEALRQKKQAYDDMMQDRLDKLQEESELISTSQQEELEGINGIHLAEQTGLDADMAKYEENEAKKKLLQEEMMRLINENIGMTDAESAVLYQKLLEEQTTPLVQKCA